VKVREQLTPGEVRAKAEEWYSRQVQILSECHGRNWSSVAPWLESYLREEIRQRLIERGWRPRR
jgi:hypothetical protein